MPLCIICESRFYYQTHMEPAETCDCTMQFTREEAQDDPQREADLLAWWKESHDKDIDEALAAWRNGGKD